MKYPTLVFLASSLALQLSGSPLAAGSSGITYEQAIAAARPAGDTNIGFDPAIVSLSKALAKAERMEIYEGLPNPFGEQEVFKNEKGSKICRQIADQWFYSLPQNAKFETVLALQQLLDGGLFRPWRGMKLCGGFHADYAVALTEGKSTLYVLFCFGCHEAKIIREGKPFAADLSMADFRLTTDLEAKSFAELCSLLAPYRKLRPPFTPMPAGR